LGHKKSGTIDGQSDGAINHGSKTIICDCWKCTAMVWSVILGDGAKGMSRRGGREVRTELTLIRQDEFFWM